MNKSERVESILKHSQRARDDDKELVIIYMQKLGVNLTPEQIRIIRDMPSFEAITRARRKLQERGLYPASPKAEKARYEKMIEYQGEYGDANRELAKIGYRIIEED